MLAALYFVPSASASPQHATAAAHSSGTVQSSQHLDLADTGSIDTKPYLIGGSVFLVAGAALVIDATRRSRRAAL